ncbi:sigma-70 family RNA polymerase sigma factor [Weissella halotolerans]|uniref:RNA polymerase sigma-70 region 2 domain-containing protein n=1 Tax=Weissella halotolerans DSM 20190 TaxID=1123500 RepID=A0A0R2G2B4_9LACO|nr:sigma-70 family RNA polymerase sigma factor [Weissella halotolerans]KRN32405.1 hypothetical protein IV68_GL000757 [Weissella halotolerans DSM 20190]
MQTDLQVFNPLIGGVLKAAGLSPCDVQYEDYRQELYLLIWQRLKAGEDLAPVNNPALFRWLLWRLRDKQRQTWRHQTHSCLTDKGDLDGVVDPRQRLDCYLLIEGLAKKLTPNSTAARVYQLYLQQPGLSQRAYCQHLGIHRTTLHRCLKRMRQQIILTDREGN